MSDLNYTKIRDKIKELNKKRILRNIIKTIVITFFVLYFIAFVMKDRANNEFSRTLCREFVNAPRNIASLIVNKFRNGTMNYKTNIITKSERNQSNQEKNDLINTKNNLLAEKDILVNEKNNLLQEKEVLNNEKNNLLQEKEALSNEKNNLLQEKEALSNDKNNLLQENQTLKNQINVKNQKPSEKSPEQIVNEQENAEKNQLIGYSNIIKQQKEVDDMLLSELNSGDYTFDDPLVVLDPYGVAPLCAVVIFKTNEDVKISVEMDKDEEETKHNFYGKTGYKKEHIIPIYGLYANKENMLYISATTKSGLTQTKKIGIKTAELPKILLDTAIIPYSKRKENYCNGFNYLYCGTGDDPNHKIGFDKNGQIRYILMRELYSFNMAMNYNQLNEIYLNDKRIILVVNPLGKILKMYLLENETINMGVHHDIEILRNSFICTTEGDYEGTCESSLTEVSISSGKQINRIDYSNYLQKTRKVGRHYSNYDWIHLNSIIEDRGDYIISSNNQSAIIKNSRVGEIKWILSDPTGWYTFWKDKLLKPIGKGFEYPYNQHAVEMLPDYDNDPNTIDIILFDNGSSRNEVLDEKRYNEKPKNRLYSRLVHYRIDEKEMTVKQLWEYGKSRPELFSEWEGDADLLLNGNYLGCFVIDLDYPGFSNKSDLFRSNTVLVECSRTKEIIWECVLQSKRGPNRHRGYRCERLMPYNDEAEDLQIGIPCKNLISEDIYKKNGLTKE